MIFTTFVESTRRFYFKPDFGQGGFYTINLLLYDNNTDPLSSKYEMNILVLKN